VFVVYQIFRSAVIEAVKVRVAMMRDGELLIPTFDFDNNIFEVLPLYLAALQQLDIPPPIVLMITLQGVRGARISRVSEGPLHTPSVIPQSSLELPEIIIEQYGSEHDYQKAARPAFDALWNTGGYIRSKHFDETGRWTPPGRR
jgi:hypothetical protein